MQNVINLTQHIICFLIYYKLIGFGQKFPLTVFHFCLHFCFEFIFFLLCECVYEFTFVQFYAYVSHGTTIIAHISAIYHNNTITQFQLFYTYFLFIYWKLLFLYSMDL